MILLGDTSQIYNYFAATWWHHVEEQNYSRPTTWKEHRKRNLLVIGHLKKWTGYANLRELMGYIRGVGARHEQRTTPVAQERKKARLNPQFSANSLFLYPPFGPASINIARTSFLIIYALQFLSISNHTFILAQNNLPSSCLQEDFLWSTFTFKPLLLWTLPILHWKHFSAKVSCGTEPSGHPVPKCKITTLCLETWFSTA